MNILLMVKLKIEKMGKKKYLILIISIFYTCSCLGQDVHVNIVSFSHLTKEITVMVENNSGDSISYNLYPLIKIDGYWIPYSYCIDDDLEDFVSVVRNPKHWQVDYGLCDKEVKIHNGHIYETLIDLHIYSATERLHNLLITSRRFQKILKDKKKAYCFDEIEKQVRLVGEKVLSKEKIVVYSEIFK